MAREPRNYQSLRDEHSRAADDALARHLEQSQAPASSAEVNTEQPRRPASPGWAQSGGMAAQQGSAQDYLRYTAGLRQEAPTAAADAAAALDQHIESRPAGVEQGATTEALDPGRESNAGPEADAAAAALEQHAGNERCPQTADAATAELEHHLAGAGHDGGDIRQEFSAAEREVFGRNGPAPPGSGAGERAREPEIDLDI